MMANWAPNRKITVAGGLGLPVATILVWIATSNGITIPAEVGSAIGALISTAFGYFIPEKEG